MRINYTVWTYNRKRLFILAFIFGRKKDWKRLSIVFMSTQPFGDLISPVVKWGSTFEHLSMKTQACSFRFSFRLSWQKVLVQSHQNECNNGLGFIPTFKLNDSTSNQLALSAFPWLKVYVTIKSMRHILARDICLSMTKPIINIYRS